MAPELNPGEVAGKAGETAGGGLAKAREFLTRKVGPMPMWGWIAGAAGAIGLALWLKSRGSSLPGLDSLTGAGADSALAGGGAGAGSSSGTLGGPPIPGGGGSGTGAGSGSSGSSGSGSSSSGGGSSSSSSAGLPDNGLGDVVPGIGQQSGTTDGGVAPTQPITTVGDVNPAYQGIIGTGGGPNTTGRTSGTQIYGGADDTTPAPASNNSLATHPGKAADDVIAPAAKPAPAAKAAPAPKPAPASNNSLATHPGKAADDVIAPAKQGPGAGTNHVNDTTGQSTRRGGTQAL